MSHPISLCEENVILLILRHVKTIILSSETSSKQHQPQVLSFYSPIHYHRVCIVFSDYKNMRASDMKEVTTVEKSFFFPHDNNKDIAETCVY